MKSVLFQNLAGESDREYGQLPDHCTIEIADPPPIVFPGLYYDSYREYPLCFDENGYKQNYSDLDDLYIRTTEIRIGGKESNFWGVGLTNDAPRAGYDLAIRDSDGDGHSEISMRKDIDVSDSLLIAAAASEIVAIGLTTAAGVAASGTPLTVGASLIPAAALISAAGIFAAAGVIMGVASHFLDGYTLSLEFNFEPGSIIEAVVDFLEGQAELLLEIAQDTFEKVKETAEDFVETFDRIQDCLEIDITPSVQSSYSRLQALMD